MVKLPRMETELEEDMQVFKAQRKGSGQQVGGLMDMGMT